MALRIKTLKSHVSRISFQFKGDVLLGKSAHSKMKNIINQAFYSLDVTELHKEQCYLYYKIQYIPK